MKKNSHPEAKVFNIIFNLKINPYHEKITRAEFNSSFFYIAPGIDFEPLMRFSHMCDTFDEVLE
jgi:hypothetical protein